MNSVKYLVGLCHPKQHLFGFIQRAGFKSRYSLDKLYPQSSLDITAAPRVPKNTDDTFSGVIPMGFPKITKSADGRVQVRACLSILTSRVRSPFEVDQLSWTYSASSGPGGQNVNKVNTKVDLRFHVESASWIPDKLKENFVKKFRTYINKDGFLVLRSDRTRYQTLNVADCLDKLRYMVRDAERPAVQEPSPDALAIELARHEKASRERLRTKRIRSEIKRSRQDQEL